MKKNHICKILVVSICLLFIGVSLSSATSNDNMSKATNNLKKLYVLKKEIKLQNLDNENLKLFENIKDLLDKSNSAKFLLLQALNFFLLWRYFLNHNNQEWAEFSFNMFIFCMLRYFTF